MKKNFFILLLGILSLYGCHSKPFAEREGKPSEWWTPVPVDHAFSWEVLPQDAGPGEVILSKRNELGILSNFAATPFEYHGKKYASVEGFWQMMKYPEGPKDERFLRAKNKWNLTRDEVSKMTGFEAKDAGKKADEIMKELKIDWVTFEGKKMVYREKAKGNFYKVIYAAEYEKLEQNEKVREVLYKTGNLILRPDHHEEADAAPAWRYYDIWMELRPMLK